MAHDIFKIGPQGKIDAKLSLTNGGIYTEDWKVSAQNNSFLQRGSFTLVLNKVFVTLPRPYLSAISTQNITFIVTSQTGNHMFVESIAKNSSFGATNISNVCGFTVSGSGTDSGYWLTIGYK